MKEEEKSIDIFTVFDHIKKRKSLFLKVTVITAIVSAIYILLVPRVYTSTILLAPELGDITGKSSLSSLASSFGFNIDNNAMSDAIYPDLYPQLMATNDFAYHLVKYKVTNADHSLSTTYYDYLLHHQKKNPWAFPLRIISTVKNILTDSSESTQKSKDINLFSLTKDQTDVLNIIKRNIQCEIDSKSGIITITAKDQDPLIVATIANAAKDELQNAITQYRTNKAQVDLDYFRKLTVEAKAAYEKARQLYGSYADANIDVLLESYRSKQNDLENDMQLKFNTYSTLNAQLQQAIAKVQENTPVFTVIMEATVPLRPSHPKRMVFVVVMIIFAWVGTTLFVCRKELQQMFRKGF
ncbi:MAG: Wzz/FepE/Etk N-terminal domain-containing protein [Prevotella sp.]